MKNTGIMKSIKFHYKMAGLNYDEVFKKTKMLLAVYKNVCWETSLRANEYHEQLQLESKRLDVALDFLMEYSCELNKNRFISQVSSFFQTKWLIDLVAEAKDHVYSYPYNGKLYADIISLYYMNGFEYTENDMLDVLNMERSNYYAKKKEATALIGFCLWGVVIPRYSKLSQSDKSEIDILNKLDKPACTADSA